MYEKGVITISEWYKGQVKHPIYGFGTIRNVDVFENKGIARLRNRSQLDSSITVTALPISEVYDSYGNTYTLTGHSGVGAVYKNGTSIASGLTNTWDMVIYKDYLFVRHSTVMSCYGPLSSGGAQWFANADTGYVNYYRGALLVGQDDALYSGNGNYVSKTSVTEAAVGVVPTISTNLTALDLPDGQYVTCLEEYGTKIVIGTQGGATYASRSSATNARLYAWNRQLGTLGNPGLADLPVIFSENGINAIKQHANKLYVSAGSQGNIYVTDATNYAKIATLPYTPIGANYASTVFANALEVSNKGTLLVGLTGDLSSIVKTGVYEIDLNAEGYPVTYFMPSSTTDGTLYIGFINNKDYQTLKVGWSNNSSYGVDITDSEMYTSYGGVIESPLIKVGDYNTKKTFQFVQFDLADLLVTGQNIRISYRKNTTDSYTTIGTWGYSTLGGVISFQDNAAISDCEYIQLKIELDQALTTLYGNNINLISVKLW